jgi:hypothetical protein
MPWPRRLPAAVCLVLAAALPGRPADAPPVADDTADEQLLRGVGLGLTSEQLRDYLRGLVPTEARRAKLIDLARQLGSPAYAARELASAELARAGAPARRPLRSAVASPDPEVARRARIALALTERAADPALPAAAARLLAGRSKPGDAAADADLLLTYLPETDDEVLAEEVRSALTALVRKAGAPGPAVRAALARPEPIQRGAAGAAVAALDTGRPLAQPLLADREPTVRLRVALALATAGDRSAVPVLIDLLAELPPEQSWPAEDLLERLAGDSSPDTGAGRLARDAWKTWWAGPGANADLGALSAESTGRTGGTLVVFVTTPGGGGRVFEQGPAGPPRWRIEGLSTPVDAAMVGPRRLLVAEFSANRVTERDLTGKVLWQKEVPVPLACQRLPGGRTFIAARDRLLEVDRTGLERQILARPAADIRLAARFRDGWCAFVTSGGRCTLVDPAGRERAGWAVNAGSMFGQMEALRNGHLLVPEYGANRVVEYDRTGHPVWQAPAPQVISATRTPGGRTLAVNQQGQEITELDRSGKVVWRYPADGSPWVARR